MIVMVKVRIVFVGSTIMHIHEHVYVRRGLVGPVGC